MTSQQISSSCTTPKVVRFQLDYNLKSLLLNFANENNGKSYEDLLIHIRDLGQEIRDDDLMQLLKEARSCILILGSHFNIFVQLVLILRWTHRSNEVIEEFKGFLQDLCTAHNGYTKSIINHLISYLKSDFEDWDESGPGENSLKCYQHIHDVLKSIFFSIPLSKSILLNSIKNSYPFFKKSVSEYRNFVYNILWITQYEPSLRKDFLTIIIDKLIIIDVNCPRSQLEEDKRKEENMMDVDEDGLFLMDGVTEKPNNIAATSLDESLIIIYKYLWFETHSTDGELLMDKMKPLYFEIKKIFEDHILRSHATSHVQFILFYLFGMKPGFGELFVQLLWKQVLNVSIPPILRQAAVCYMASFLARANYLPLFLVKETLTEMAKWIHSYIDKSGMNTCEDHRAHVVFYAVCQSLFYIFGFLHRDLVKDKGLAEIQALGFPKIVTCRLNPLRYCLPSVVSNFASIARSYQIAYCYNIIERNSRYVLPTVYHGFSGEPTGISGSPLDSYFPFDPYLLTKSKETIAPFYREYIGPVEKEKPTNQSSKSRDEDDDDFLELPTTPTKSSALNNFSYSSSPGFLHT